MVIFHINDVIGEFQDALRGVKLPHEEQDALRGFKLPQQQQEVLYDTGDGDQYLNIVEEDDA